jgi:ABC-2 type transport system permease protein
MIISILRKEWQQQFRSSRFQLSLILMALLGLASLVLGYVDHAEAQAVYSEGSQTAREHWLTQGEKNPHSAAHYGMYVFKPPTPLRMIDQGVAPFAGVATFSEAHIKNDATYEPALDQSGIMRFGVLTPTFFLVYLVPLFLIFAAFDSISGEREQGTWRLVLSCHPQLWSVVFSKWLNLFGLAMVLTTMVLVAGWLMAMPLGASMENWQQCTSLWLGYALYYGAFINVALLVSALFQQSHRALMVLMIFWIATTLIVPKWGTSMAEKRFPTPDRAAWIGEQLKKKADGMDGHNPKDDRVAQIRQETLDKYGVSEVSELPINIDGLLMQEDEVYGNQVFDRYGAQLEKVYADQRGVFLFSGLFSPTMPMRQWSLAMTWGNAAHHSRFNAQVEAHRRKWVEMLNTDMIENSKSGEWGYRVGEELWEKVEDFKYQPLGFADQWQQSQSYFLSLLGWLLLSSLALAAWVLKRGGTP